MPGENHVFGRTAQLERKFTVKKLMMEDDEPSYEAGGNHSNNTKLAYSFGPRDPEEEDEEDEDPRDLSAALHHPSSLSLKRSSVDEEEDKLSDDAQNHSFNHDKDEGTDISTTTFSKAEFLELLSNDSYIHLDRLRAAARHGVPTALRGEVWKYLIGVSKPDRSQEISFSKKMQDDFLQLCEHAATHALDPAVTKHKNEEVRRYLKNQPRHMFTPRKEARSKLQHILRIYLCNHSHVDFYPGMVDLLAPFITCLSSKADVYYCYCSLLDYIDHKLSMKGLDQILANFLMLFRTFQSELCVHFEDEELGPKEWIVIWLKQWLSRSLPVECVLRLWDTYFSSDEGYDLHIYVCLAILMYCKEDLMEFEYSELRAFLVNLPVMDMDQIIMQAYNIRDEVVAMQLL